MGSSVIKIELQHQLVVSACSLHMERNSIFVQEVPEIEHVFSER